MIEKLKKDFPFLTYGKYSGNEYIGIVQNSDSQFVSMYCYELIPTDEMKKKFLEYGELWWWESNRRIPINIFLGHIFKPYKLVMRTFIKKDFEIIHGPCTSLDELANKRIKKRQIQLIKKIK